MWELCLACLDHVGNRQDSGGTPRILESNWLILGGNHVRQALSLCLLHILTNFVKVLGMDQIWQKKTFKIMSQLTHFGGKLAQVFRRAILFDSVTASLSQISSSTHILEHGRFSDYHKLHFGEINTVSTYRIHLFIFFSW